MRPFSFLCLLLLGFNTGVIAQAVGTTAQLGFPGTMTYLVWNDSSSNWQPSQRYTYSYNADGLQTEVITEDYTNGGYSFTTKIKSHFNAAKKLIQRKEYLWQDGRWVDYFMEAYDYDEFRHPIQGKFLLNSGATWDTTELWRISYIYHDANGSIDTAITQKYQATTHNWSNSSKQEYTYGTAPWWHSRTDYQFDGQGWQPTAKLMDVVWYSYENDIRDHAVMQTYSDWAGWLDESRFSTAHHGLSTTVLTEISPFPGLWIPQSRHVEQFDSAGHTVMTEFSGLGFPPTISTYYSHPTYDLVGRLVADSVEYADLVSRQNSHKFVYADFRELPTTPPLQTLDVTVYPNPVTEYLHFDLRLLESQVVEITIHDQLGRQLIRKEVQMQVGSVAMGVAGELQAGTYCYRVKTNKFSKSGKFVVVR